MRDFFLIDCAYIIIVLLLGLAQAEAIAIGGFFWILMSILLITDFCGAFM